MTHTFVQFFAKIGFQALQLMISVISGQPDLEFEIYAIVGSCRDVQTNKENVRAIGVKVSDLCPTHHNLRASGYAKKVAPSLVRSDVRSNPTESFENFSQNR